MPHIRVIPPEEATGELQTLYEEVRRRRGSVANVYQIHSLRPDTMETHMGFYLSILYGPSGLSRLEREAIAVVVSRANRCEYCVGHHSEALAKYEKNADLVRRLGQGERPADLPPRLRALLDFADRLTRSPQADSKAAVEALREAGLSDEEILTATLTASYFNFVNRLVSGLGVEPETAKLEYKY